MKKMADKNRRDVTFAEGDWVMVKLRPHRQSSISGTYSKLAKRFYGPYKIVEHMGKAAFKLQLPKDARIHPVFRCSLLKPFHHSTTEHIDLLPLPANCMNGQPLITPLVILATRRGTDSNIQVLVSWKGLPPKETTWEDWNSLKNTFHLEDNVLFQAVGNDMKEWVTMARPNRKSTRPKYLHDYV